MAFKNINLFVRRGFFQKERAYFLGDWAFQEFVREVNKLGRIDGCQEDLFSCPKKTADKAMKKAKGSIRALEDALGLPKGAFGAGPVHRVDIKNAQNWNLHKATGYEISSNCYFNTCFTDKNRPDIVFAKKKDGLVSVCLENGSVAEVEYEGDSAESRGYVYVDGYRFELIDDSVTPAKDLARLNGKYVTVSGIVHHPNLKGYTGVTSGGLMEAVTNRVANNTEELSHCTLFEDVGTFRIVENYTGLFNPTNSYLDAVEEIDDTVSDFAEKTNAIKQLQRDAWENILLNRTHLENSGKTA